MAARKDVHIGHEIERVLHERGITVTDFAARICCHRKNVYDIFRRKSIDIDHLIRISEALGYDFIQNCYYDCGEPAEQRFTLVLRDGSLTIDPVEK